MTQSSTQNNRWSQQIASSPLLWPIRMTGQFLEQAGKALQGQQDGGQGSPSAAPHIASERRQPLSFGKDNASKGNVSLMLESINRLAEHSKPAAVAMADYVAQQDSPYYSDARNLKAGLLLSASPSRAMVADATRAVRDSLFEGGSLEQQLTDQLRLAELQYLRWIRGDVTVPVTTMVNNLETVADGFASLRSQQRQAVTRIILADLLLHRSQKAAADRQLATALVLLGQLYDKTSMMKLAQEIDTGIIDLTVPSVSNRQRQQLQSQGALS